MDKELFEYELPNRHNRCMMGCFLPRHNNKYYSNGKILYTYPILEKFGIIEYQNKRYEEMIMGAAKTIKEKMQYSKTKYEYYISDERMEYYCGLVKVYPQNSVSWIKELDIYFCWLNDSHDFDCWVLGDVDDNGEIISKCHPIYKNININPLIIKDGVIERGSMILMIDNLENFDFYGAISHELKRLYDINIRYINMHELNKDVILAYKANVESGIRFETDYLRYSEEQAKQFITSLNAKELYCLLIDDMYVLNKSEVSARLNQIYSKLNMLKRTDMDIILSDIHDYFMSIDVYRYYDYLYRFFLKIEKYANENVVEELNKEYGRSLGEILLMKNKISFKDYINTMKSRMEYFFNKCDSLFADRVERLNRKR